MSARDTWAVPSLYWTITFGVFFGVLLSIADSAQRIAAALEAHKPVKPQWATPEQLENLAPSRAVGGE